ncbi:MAG: hypothetical protein ABI806_10370 [Candidatus Solibacter sp.]
MSQSPRIVFTCSILLAATCALHAQPRAKAWVSAAPDGTLDPSHSFNSSGAINTVSRTSAGQYVITYPGVGNGSGGMTHVTSTSTTVRCKSQTYTSNGADISQQIACRDLTGTAADSGFNALFYRESRASATAWFDAYFWNDQNTPATDYVPPANWSWNSRGAGITLNRTGTGLYTATLAGFTLPPNGGSVLVTASGFDTAYCNPIAWSGAPLAINIGCYSPAGAPMDTHFLVSFFTDVAFGVNVASDQTSGAYAWANDTAASAYTPNASYSLNTGGAIAGNRSDTGTYNMTFTGLSASNSTVTLVSAYGGNQTCSPGLVTGAGSAAIPVTCVTVAGTPTDARYDVLHLTVPPPAVLSLTHTHSGSFYQGQNGATYSIAAGNSGGPTLGTVTITETVPAGMTLVSMGGTGWTCAGNTCSRSDTPPPGLPYPSITATVNVSLTAATPLIPSATVSGGGAQPVTQTDSTLIATCSFAILPPVVSSYSQTAASGSFVVLVANACGWTPVTNKTFVTVTTGTVFGSATVNYNVAANPNATARSATVTAGNATFGILQAAATVSPGLRFVPVTPCRIADTRNVSAPALVASTPRDFAIAGFCGIPDNAVAFSLNLTVVPIGPLGFLSVWPAGQPQPSVSTLNSTDGRVKANAAIVPAGLNGAVTLFGSNATNAIIDINGYFVPASGSSNLAFYPVTPCRIADTRFTVNLFGGPALDAGVARSFPILSGTCGIPATAQAYALNMTVLPSGGLGFLSTWPTGQGQPSVSTLNAPTGTTTANMAIVPAGTDGSIEVFASNPANLIIDINGYFAPPGAPGALDFYTATPCRVADTRNVSAPSLTGSVNRTFQVASTCGIPADAKAFSLNATVVPPASLGFLTLWGSGSQPTVSTLNASDASIVANAALITAGTNGVVTAIASSNTNLILDINGYFR